MELKICTCISITCKELGRSKDDEDEDIAFEEFNTLFRAAICNQLRIKSAHNK